MDDSIESGGTATADDRRAALSGLALDKGAAFAPRRKRRVPRSLAVLLVVAIAGAAWVAFHSATAVPEVRTGAVVRRSPIIAAEITTASGYVRARTRASVASKTQGQLVSVAVDEGDLVAAGQLLAVVDHEEADAAIAAAAARVDVARHEVAVADAQVDEAIAAVTSARAALAERSAALDATRAELAQADAEFTRIEDLVTRAIRSAADLDRARETRDVAHAQVRRAEAALVTGEKDVERAVAARASAEYARKVQDARIAIEAAEQKRAEVVRQQSFLLAPFAGVVLRREAEPGEVVSPANTGASGSKTAIVTLADFATLEVEVDVYERDVARITAGAPCRVVLDAFRDRPLSAHVRLVRPTADRTRATVQVYVAFASVPDFARPEMVARVTFYRPDTDALAADELLVPSAAITTRDGKDGVFVLGGEEVRFVIPEFGAVDGADRKVLGGLEAGKLVVLDPAAKLKDGDHVVVAGR